MTSKGPALAGVLVPLPNTSSHRDDSELTVGEHRFELVHVRSGGSNNGSSSAAAASAHSQANVAALLKTGNVFATLQIPVERSSSGGGGGGVSTSPRSHTSLDDDHDLSPLPSSSASPTALALAASSSSSVQRAPSTFQLYAKSDRSKAKRKATAEAQESPLFHKLVHSLSSIFVPYPTTTAPAASSHQVVQSMHFHPTLPILALLIKDEVHFYDVFGTPASSSALVTQAGLSIDKKSVVSGVWVNRVLKHPFMSGVQCVRFNAVGGNLVAVPTDAGIICLWQLVSVLAGAAGSNASISSSSSSNNANAQANRKLGAWLHILSDSHHENQVVDSVEFSPCGRWMVSASSQSSTFLVWDVSAALSTPTPNTEGLFSTQLNHPAAVPMQKLYSWIMEPTHGIDLISWNASGTALAVASHPRGKSLVRRGVASAIKASVQLWKKITAGNDADKQQANKKQKTAGGDPIDPAEGEEKYPVPSPVASSNTLHAPSVDSGANEPLPTGTLTIWNTSSWTHQSWETSTPLTSVCWSSIASQASFGGASSLLANNAASNLVATRQSIQTPPSLLLLSMQNSDLVQSLQLSSSASSLLASHIRLNLERFDGIPTTRSPSGSDALERYPIGGAVRSIQWSPSERRLAITFDEDQEGSELVALFATEHDETDTWQTLPVGMIRGPICPCQGRLHKQHIRGSSGSADMDMEDDSKAEGKYDSEEKVYPSLHDSSPPSPYACRERNVPVHLSWMQGELANGELLAISWKFGQVSFIPCYFEK